MLDLQATLEFAVELTKFHNIDLFQRGFYQLRLFMKSSTKSPLQYEVTLPRYFGQECAYPPIVQDKTGISKTFQILYKNEEVEIGDFFIFKVYVLVDSKKDLQIAESLSEAELQLQVDLHFRTSEDPPSCAETLDQISSRVIKIHLDSSHAVHSHIPLLFDYFHLSTLSMTIHGTLLGLHQATFSPPKPPKSGWIGKLSSNNTSPSRQLPDVPSMESVLFGDVRPPPVAAKASPDEIQIAGAQLGQAYQVYRTMASILLMRRQSLGQKFQELMPLTGPSDEFKLETTNVSARLDIMCEIIRGLINPDDIVEAVNTSMAQLSGEVCLLWTQFLEFFGQNPRVISFLRQEYHRQRMQRFAEGFFHSNHSPMDLITQSHFTPQDYTHVTNTYRSSSYCESIQPLPVECTDLDGIPNEIPVIFEDVFSYDASTPDGSDEKDVAVGTNKKASPTSANPSTNGESDSQSSQKNSSNGKSQQRKGSKKKGKRRIKYTTMSHIKHIRPEFLRKSKPSHRQRDLSCYQVTGNPKIYQLQRRNNSLDEQREESLEGVSASSSLPSIPSCVKSGNMKNGEGRMKKRSLQSAISDEQLVLVNTKSKASGSFNGAIDVIGNSSDISHRHGAKETFSRGSAIRVKEDAGTVDRLEEEGVSNGYDALNSVNSERDQDKQTSLVTDDIAVIVDGSQSEEAGGSSDSLERIPNGYYEEPEVDELGAHLEEHLALDGTSESRSNRTETGEAVTDSDRTESDPISLPLEEVNIQTDGGHVSYERQDTMPVDEIVHVDESKDIHPDSRIHKQPSKSQRQNSRSPSVLSSCTGCFSFMNSSVSPNSSFSVEPCLIRPVLPYESSASTSLSSVQATGSHTSKDSSESSEENTPGQAARAQYISAKKDFCQHLGGCLHLYSDLGSFAAVHPYFSIPRPQPEQPENEGGGEVHLVVCVHGLDGNRADLRLLKMYIEMGLPEERFEFLMSESNQDDTFAGFDRMTDRLVQEILYYVELLRLRPKKVSFIGHSLGNLIIRAALAKPAMGQFLGQLHTFLSLSGPHLGQLYNSSALVNTGLWVMQKWKKSNSLLQLSLRDHADPRQSFLYQLSKNPGLAMFKNVLLVGSLQDRYVPVHSARVEMCKAAAKDKSIYGTIYAEMLNNLLEPVITSPQVTLVRYDVHHNLQTSANTLIGRAAHIAFLDSELFLEKFLMVSALKYFK